MAKLQDDLREFIELLNSHKVDYVIVGGHAVAFHGHPRFTGDIDFLIRMTLPHAERLLAVLREFGFGILDITARDLLEPSPSVGLSDLVAPPSTRSHTDVAGPPGAYGRGERHDEPTVTPTLELPCVCVCVVSYMDVLGRRRDRAHAKMTRSIAT